MQNEVTMEKIVSLCKRRGFIYPGSEIYGGFNGFWDYGPLGVELKNNLKRQWWRTMVYERDNVVGIDAAIIMNPEVWEKSGHLKAFSDPLVECKTCHKRFRADHEDELAEHEKDHGGQSAWTDSKTFNLMTEVFLGVTEPKQKAYLRGEITQGAFVNFGNVVASTRLKIPFGIAQIGKAFRNEITPGNFTFRSREFEQMELEYFIKPEKKDEIKIFDYWMKQRLDWYISMGIEAKKLRYRKHAANEMAHYARLAEDIEYQAPFGWSEFEGIHHRSDFDLTNHGLKYKDEATGESYVPWVIETSGGVDRAALFFLIEAYHEEDKRVVLKLNSKLAPYKVAVFPLLANKPKLVELARKIYQDLRKDPSAGGLVAWDDRGNIGKRYYAQDEIGTPYCITVDFDSLAKGDVTVRQRDSMKQERVGIKELKDYLKEKLN